MVRSKLRWLAEQESTTARLVPRFARIRAELKVREDFPDDVLAAANHAAGAPDLPSADCRDIPFVTVDPPGATDLDQALHISYAADDGFEVHYAIADVPAFVRPGGPIDVEARLRGQTIYAPDCRVPLHPPALSEDAASLLPDQDRPAFVWSFHLNGDGELVTSDVRRAMVRSRLRLDYEQIQQAADAHPDPKVSSDDDLVVTQAVLMREVGVRRMALEIARGGASLPLPDQEVHEDDGRFRLTLRPLLPSEDWNAQLSLMTGMAAATIMLTGGVGLLRTMAAPNDDAVGRFRGRARALRVPWPEGMSYGQFLGTLTPKAPAELALMFDAGSLFRGAGYTPLIPGEPLPANTIHAAVAAPYAHVTAPLRRLVDRFGLVTCAALTAGEPVPEWVLAALADLPGIMRSTDDLAAQVERRSTDVVEAAVLAPRVGERFEAIVVDHTHGGIKVQLADPPVLALAQGQTAVGERAIVELTSVDLDRGRVELLDTTHPATAPRGEARPPR